MIDRNKVVAELDVLQADMDALKRLQAKSRQCLRPTLAAFLPSLLIRAFADQLVSQDSTDEPAKKLLERLRSEHENKN